MVVGRAATTLQRQERKHLIGQLRQAQVWVVKMGTFDPVHGSQPPLPHPAWQHELNIDISRRMHPMHEAGSSAWDSPLRSRNPSEISLSSMARRINADMYAHYMLVPLVHTLAQYVAIHSTACLCAYATGTV